MTLRYALVVDGGSDAVIREMVAWLVHEHRPALVVEDPFLHRRGGESLSDAIDVAVRRSGCRLVVAHRDAEDKPWLERIAEFPARPNLVRVVPVRMTEAWLLGDEEAIRKAAGNPRGDVPLGLPPMGRVEHTPDPKTLLRQHLLTAAGEPAGRRRKALIADLPRRAHLVASYTAGWGHLRVLPAFRAFELELLGALPD